MLPVVYQWALPDRTSSPLLPPGIGHPTVLMIALASAALGYYAYTELKKGLGMGITAISKVLCATKRRTNEGEMHFAHHPLEFCMNQCQVHCCLM